MRVKATRASRPPGGGAMGEKRRGGCGESEGRRGRGACVRNSYRALTEAG